MDGGERRPSWRAALVALLMFFVLRAVIWDRYAPPLWVNLVILGGVILALTRFKRLSRKAGSRDR